MREVSRDSKWNDETDARMDEQMQGLSDYADRQDPGGSFEAELISGPSETDLVIVTLLMRLYDVQMALLSNTNKQLADSIYDAHNRGEHFNPEIFIPAITEQSDDNKD